MTEIYTESFQVSVVIRGNEALMSLTRQGDIWTLEGDGVGASGATPKDAFFGVLGIIGGKNAMKRFEKENEGGENL